MPSTADPRSAAGLLAATGAFLLPVAYSPSVHAPFWSPKAAVLLVLGTAGLALLPGLWRGPTRPAAWAATAFGGLAVLSTAWSPAPLNAVTGLYNWGTGLMFVLALIGCWALGVRVPDRDRQLVVRALAVGLTVSGVVAVLQVLVSIGVPSLELSGRAAGLAGNAAHLGTLMAGGAAILAWHARRSWRWGAAIAAPAAVVQLSGTRFALAVLVVAVLVAVVSIIGRRVPAGAAGRWVRGVVLVVAAVSGLGAGALLAEVGDVQTAIGRASGGPGGEVGGGGVRVRLEVWRYAADAIAERPVLGHGPGRFRAATSADHTLESARLGAGDALFTDAHNLLIEHAVTTGLVAAAALAVWLALAGLGAGGPLRWFALAVLAMGLVQPASVQTTPMLFLALGLAHRTPVPEPRRLPLSVGVLAGLALAGALVVGDVRLHQARLDFDLVHARAADRLLRPWPEPATILARAHSFLALSGESTEELALHWRREAVGRDPTDPALRILLGDELQAADRPDAARSEYRRALRHNPYSTAALSRLARLALAQGDRADARRFLERALEVGPSRSLERRLRALGRDA